MTIQRVGRVLVLVIAAVVAASGPQPQASSQTGMHDGMQQSGSHDHPSAKQNKVDIALTTDPSPAQKGNNTFRVKLTDQTGQPIAGAEVTITCFMPGMPSMNMPAMKTVIKGADKGGGLYEGKGALGSGGVWQVTITARKSGKTIATRKLTVRVTGGM